MLYKNNQSFAISDPPLYYANALEYFYALYSLFALGLYDFNEMEDGYKDYIIEYANPLIDYNLIYVYMNQLLFTESALKLYIHLITSKYKANHEVLLQLAEISSKSYRSWISW